VLPEINSPLDPSQYGESARQRCMAPGCIGTWLRCGSGGTSPSPHLAVRGHTTAGDPPGGTAAGVARNQQSVRSVAIRRIRKAKVHGTWLHWHLAALRVPGSGGTSPSPHLVVRGHTTAGDLPGDTAAGVARNQQSVRFVAIRLIRAAKVHGTWLH
jgi:hypothetical protein